MFGVDVQIKKGNIVIFVEILKLEMTHEVSDILYLSSLLLGISMSYISLYVSL